MAKSHQTSSATVDGCEIKVGELTCGPTDDSSTSAKITHRKKREELSSSATKGIKREFVDIVITFD